MFELTDVVGGGSVGARPLFFFNFLFGGGGWGVRVSSFTRFSSEWSHVCNGNKVKEEIQRIKEETLAPAYVFLFFFFTAVGPPHHGGDFRLARRSSCVLC